MHSRVADTALVSFQSENQAVDTLEVNSLIDRLLGELSGRMVHSRPRGPWLEPRRRHRIVSLSKAFHHHYLVVTTLHRKNVLKSPNN